MFTGLPVGSYVYGAPSRALPSQGPQPGLTFTGLPVGPDVYRAPSRALPSQGSQPGLTFTGLPVGPDVYRAPSRALPSQGPQPGLSFTGLPPDVYGSCLYSAQALPLQCSGLTFAVFAVGSEAHLAHALSVDTLCVKLSTAVNTTAEICTRLK